PTEIMLGEDLAIHFVIENPNNKTITRMSTTRIGDFFTQIIEIRLEAYESKLIWYRIIPHVAGEYHVWIDGQTGDFKVIPTEVIIVVDPLEELNLRINNLENASELKDLRIDYLETTLEIYSSATLVAVETIATTTETTIETIIIELNEEIEELENKISNLQTN
ncbi:unnamed protein product, partial [marine sediment metagenome]